MPSATLRERVGLKPVIRRIWVDEWTVRTANINWRFKWLWLYGFVHPQSGQTYWWILPYLNIQLFNKVLADFAQHFDIGTRKQVVLVVDRAGWQKARPSRTTTGYRFRIFAFPLPRITTRTTFMDTYKSTNRQSRF